ncbi:subunit of tubulin prefoldin [Xylographa carneopallida]|nr:subunit of tubulin prefoldin [Xylographa carneopallida]
MKSISEAQAHTVDLASLSVQQLSSVKKRLDDELEHLTTAFTKLRVAQNKFCECLTSIREGISSMIIGKPLLVPLTTSLYVPGSLADAENIMVDVGTGFYVEKAWHRAVQA